MRRRSFTAASLGFAMSPALHANKPSSRPGTTEQTEPPTTPRSYFGMHIHRLLPDPSLRPTTVWPGELVGSLRLWDATTRWADLAPRPGRWDFERLDAYVSLSQAHGAPVLYTLGSTPRWASARPDEPGPYGPGCAAEPLAMQDWDDYVRRVVVRYRGRIQAYEVWNEPYFSEFAADRRQPTFFSGSARQMVAMTHVAREAIKSLDPAALLATPGFVNGVHRLDLFLEAGGAPLVDIIAYHFYASDAAQFSSQVQAVRAVLARRRLDHLPLWNTESGVERVRIEQVDTKQAVLDDDDHAAAARLAQFLILGAGTGIGRFFYYAWDNDLTGMVDRTGASNARRPAFERVQRWLLESSLRPPISIGPGAYQVEVEQSGRRYLLAWSDRTAAFALRVPPGWRIDAVEPLLGDPDSPHAVIGADRVTLQAAPARMRLTHELASS